MKKQSRKLNLNRETLMPLQDGELDAINGGLTPTVSVVVSAASRASSQACIQTVSAVVTASIATIWGKK